MITVLLVLEAFVTLALIGVVLIQRSEGGGLGLGTSQGMGSFMSGRGTANLLTRATAILATVFMVLSLVLALLYRHGSGNSAAEAILNGPVPAAQTAPAPAPKPAPKPAPALPPIPGESSTTSSQLPAIPGTAAPTPAAPAIPATQAPKQN